MMIPAAGPPDTSIEGLDALHLSLNSPVLAGDALPVGPASAVIAVQAGSGATLLLRSLRSGALACYRGDPRSRGSEIEDALSHAEALGFLFDEEASEGGPGLVGSRGEWPGWLADLFPEEIDVSVWLSKFRWALAADAVRRPGEYGDEFERRV